MGTLSQLLKYKRSLSLVDGNGRPVRDEKDNKPIVVWIRIVGDKDIEEAFRFARIESARIRANLLNPESDDYKSFVAPFDAASREDRLQMALAGRGANWTGEALSNVVRPDLPKIEEVALDPDAPTLEEQEKLDALIQKTEEEYQDRLREFAESKQQVALAELNAMTDDELLEETRRGVVVAIPLETFLSELQEQKVWRAVYRDEACTKRGFSDVDDFRQADSVIRRQIIEAYEKLEQGHKDIKN